LLKDREGLITCERVCELESFPSLPPKAPVLPFYRPRGGPEIHEKEKKKEKNRREEGPLGL
jgi:hypothetical protein